MNSCELTASITALANALACKLSIDVFVSAWYTISIAFKVKK